MHLQTLLLKAIFIAFEVYFISPWYLHHFAVPKGRQIPECIAISLMNTLIQYGNEVRDYVLVSQTGLGLSQD